MKAINGGMYKHINKNKQTANPKMYIKSETNVGKSSPAENAQLFHRMVFTIGHTDLNKGHLTDKGQIQLDKFV
jgi:hypothetical protein